MKKSDFYYDLPENLIAQHPLEQRDSSKLMVLNTLFTKTLVSVHLLMVIPNSSNTSVFVNKLVTVVLLILLLTLTNGLSLVCN